MNSLPESFNVSALENDLCLGSSAFGTGHGLSQVGGYAEAPVSGGFL